MGKVPNFHRETVTCSLTLIGATSLPEPLETCPMPPFGIPRVSGLGFGLNLAYAFRLVLKYCLRLVGVFLPMWTAEVRHFCTADFLTIAGTEAFLVKVR